MNKWGGVLHLGLARTGATLLHGGGWWRKSGKVVGEVALTAEDHAAPQRLAAQLRGLFEAAQCAHMPLRVVLADSLVRRWMVTPPQNAARFIDCKAAAEVRHAALFGETLNGWRMCADWDTRRPFLACAMPEALYAALLEAARERGLFVLEIAPQFVVAWNRWEARLNDDAWFGVLHGDVLSFGARDRGRLCAVRDLTLPTAARLEQGRLPRLLASEALRLSLAKPEEIRLCGQLPSHWEMRELDGVRFTRVDRLPLNGTLPRSPGLALALTAMAA